MIHVRSGKFRGTCKICGRTRVRLYKHHVVGKKHSGIVIYICRLCHTRLHRADSPKARREQKRYKLIKRLGLG